MFLHGPQGGGLSFPPPKARAAAPAKAHTTTTAAIAHTPRRQSDEQLPADQEAPGHLGHLLPRRHRRARRCRARKAPSPPVRPAFLLGLVREEAANDSERPPRPGTVLPARHPQEDLARARQGRHWQRSHPPGEQACSRRIRRPDARPLVWNAHRRRRGSDGMLCRDRARTCVQQAAH